MTSSDLRWLPVTTNDLKYQSHIFTIKACGRVNIKAKDQISGSLPLTKQTVHAKF